MKRETIKQTNSDHLSNEKEIIYQVHRSRENRTSRRIYNQKEGLDYLQRKIKKSEIEQELSCLLVANLP